MFKIGDRAWNISGCWMNEFEITVTEALVRKIKVKADTYEEALNIV